MSESLAPGTYFEEFARGPRPIEGVATGTAAFIGATERGPLRPTRVASLKDYQRLFGAAAGIASFMPYAVQGFFENGGTTLYICRVVSASATIARATFGPVVVRARGPGSWGRRVYACFDQSSAAKPDNTTVFRLRLAYYAAQPRQDPAAWFADSRKPPRPTFVETFEHLVTDASSPDYCVHYLRDHSVLANLELSLPATPGTLPAEGVRNLEGGSNGQSPLDAADYRGEGSAVGAERLGLASRVGVSAALHFDAMGSLRTYWDFYLGFGLYLTVNLLLLSALMWQLASVVKTEPAIARPFIGLLCIAFLAFAFLSSLYFWRLRQSSRVNHSRST
jgi:hypothetical protein